jgi:hypothetical protein
VNRLQIVKAHGGSRKRGARERRLIGARLVALLLASCAVAAVFAAARAAESSASPVPADPAAAAQRTRQRRPQRGGTQPRRPAIDYSEFNHSSARHLSRQCSSCHVIQSLAKPDVTDFPDHPSCIECHRQQFFRGARPAICSNCHTVTGPRSEARFKFPKPNEPSEFAEVFPHSAHVKPTTLIQFRRFLGEKATTTDSCRYCHKPDARTFKPQAAPAPRSGAAAPAARPSPATAAVAPAGFELPAGTFMTTPTSHATCFQCHWQKGVEGREQEPLASQCASCHDNIRQRARAATQPAVAAAKASPAAPAATAASPAPSPARPAVPAALIVPASLARFRPARDGSWPARVSPKFVHEIDAHRKRSNDDGKEVPINCTACHTAIRRATTLELLRLKENQVQLPTCGTSACHTATTGVAQMRLSVFRELRERVKDPKFDCALCHAPPISTAEAPCGHYAAVYADAVKEKKSTRGIEQALPERCKDVIKKEGQ